LQGRVRNNQTNADKKKEKKCSSKQKKKKPKLKRRGKILSRFAILIRCVVMTRYLSWMYFCDLAKKTFSASTCSKKIFFSKTPNEKKSPTTTTTGKSK
jgi:hypothetical protein